MGSYGESATSQLDRAHRAAETAQAASASIQAAALQRENDRLRGEAGQLHQQLRDASLQNAANAAAAAARASLEASAKLQPAAQAAPAETAEQRSLRERFESKATSVDLVSYGRLRPAGAAAVNAAPAQPSPAPQQPDLAKLSPVQLIQRGLEQNKPAGGRQ
jgi:hypothetical protein